MNLIKYESFLLKENVKRTFEENYLKTLFESHKDLPKSDIIDFLHKAQQTGANPSLNQIHLIERNVKVGYEWRKVGTTVFSYNFIQAIANQTKEYEGYTTETKMLEKFDINTFEAKKMLACTVVVKRSGHSFPYTAYLDEYIQKRKDKDSGKMVVTEIWNSKPYMMLEKVALSGALRRAFPEALSGMYCEEEMESISNDLEKQVERGVIESEAQKAVEKNDEIIERIEAKIESSEEQEQIDGLMEHIKTQLGELTKGLSSVQKGKALSDLCKVKKFDELKSKSIGQLKDIKGEIQMILDEKLKRETK